MNPRYIRQLSEFESYINIGQTTESLTLDFKATINDWRLPKGAQNRGQRIADAQREVCRDISQFANTDGGCLVIGVTEVLDTDQRLKVAAGISGVDDPNGMIQWIEQAVRKCLVPATFSRDIAVASTAKGAILSVNIPPNARLVTLWDPPTIECVRRTSHGKDWMNPDEMERHMMSGSRAARLEFEAALAQASVQGVQIAGGHWTRPPGHYGSAQRWTPAGELSIGRPLHDSWFELRVPSNGRLYCVNLPFAVLRAAWVGADGRLNLLLSVRLVLEGSDFVFEPY